ncbi:RNA recognition domain-containing protein [Rutstroemia sp. NJR-2017a BBW]|nr:RNA recognition domain-containing protein [Rutstroemia sp. NJR-2017a BBW]
MAPQDSFIDEDEDTCPLCVEEFDLSDKNFQPCPCGYQFCFNNIKNNINGLCPACRRPYDEKTIKWKVVTQEEMAQFKANIQKNAKKKAEQRQKEAQKREVESLNRKHLSGLRVVQKNLVYVMGLSPSIREDELLNTLRGDKYFGQYGKIIKIVVSKAKNDSAQNSGSLGVYVTFARKEDAARCIAAVNGSQNGDRVLRAQLGTTKYCSAYLRNETCTNKQCMFLHEPGDNDDSYSRQDLSSINSVSTQRPLPVLASSSRQAPQMAAPIQQAQPVAAAAQPMTREASKDGSDSGDGSALPSSASWANRGIQQRSRRGSHATSGAASSPAISTAHPVPTEAVEEETPELVEDRPESPAEASPVDSPEEPESPPASHPEIESLGAELLRSINSDVLSYDGPKALMEEFASYPPLFDIRGGEKRRLARQQQEEERMQMEQESQTESRSVQQEPVEEEEPESGSLQLGGEPEDNGREVNQPPGFSRRPSTQLPIQRGSNAGPFGPSLGQNYTQNIGNLGTVNGRSLTPLQQQQLQILKSSQVPSTFMDHLPPGIGNPLNQGSLPFQQQGHNRQSSRYSFANESGSASSSVKPSANPKMMAQQASMMPPSSHSQQQGQFYGSSMPGPPPGLKSSGTPPIGGNMFGQGHGFGNSMGGNSVFGGSSKDNNNDMLREMLRNRGGAGANQGLDSAKREYMFPNFLHQQFPSASSTPAPASSPLASLYGLQTGAFHEFGQKQKKKGKKHRHANTSSSGGGGLVDLADPSILQARMQHQQQSNAGVGQGLFGGQAQEDLEPLEAMLSMSVDALVAESIPDEFIFTCDVSRSSTPACPPGLAPPHGHPSPAIREDPIAKPISKIVPPATPLTPSRSSSLHYIPRVATPLANVSVPSTPTPVKSRLVQETPAQAKQSIQESAKATGISKAIASQSTTTPIVQKIVQSEEEFPALGKAKEIKPVPVKTPKAATPSAKASSSTTKTAASSQKNTKASEKRATINLSIPLTTKPAPKAVETPDTPSKAAPAALTLTLPSAKPATTPAIQTSNKSLRIVSTPKVEVPPTASATPTSASGMSSTPLHPGRQFSVSEVPDTPSEHISDNASIISASYSRASSPAPSRTGQTRAQKLNTAQKNKLKKEQKERGLEAQMEAAAAVKRAEEQAPVLGRKTKQKKEKKDSSAAGGSTPAVSRPPSPTHPAPESAPQAASVEEETQDKPYVPTPASILRQLNAEGLLPADIDNLALLKPVPGLTSEKKRDRELLANMEEAVPKLVITPEDRSELLAGRPVHRVIDGSRIMLTPNGEAVRNLTPEEEQRYLRLQETIAKESGPTAFMSERYSSSAGFSLVAGRAVPNGPPSCFPNSDSNLDPVSKIQRDEALGFINQKVLTVLPNNTQLEQALNANAIPSDILRSGEAVNWQPTWGIDAAGNPQDALYGGAPPESMLGLESMTAQFASGRDLDRPETLGSHSPLPEEFERLIAASKKISEGFGKRMASMQKKNTSVLKPSW